MRLAIAIWCCRRLLATGLTRWNPWWWAYTVAWYALYPTTGERASARVFHRKMLAELRSRVAR